MNPAQGPAWEAQCHADTHYLLAALRALPLNPKSADAATEHLATLCTLRFADPSPSGYAIPMPLPPSPSPSQAPIPASVGAPSSLRRAPSTPSSTASSSALSFDQVSLPALLLPSLYHCLPCGRYPSGTTRDCGVQYRESASDLLAPVHGRRQGLAAG